MAAFLAPPAHAAFPGSNGDIAFSRLTDGSHHDVFAAAPDGSNLRNVTNSASRDDHDPVWSPDGAELAFWSVPYVATINADGSGQADLRWGGEPSFSPDGSRIAYATSARFFPESNQEIFVMNRDGSEARNLTNEPLGPEWGHDYAPAWSPDGTHVAFSRLLGSATGIYVIGPDGTGLTQLVSGPAEHPDWAPDGNAIVFDAFGDIYGVDATGIVQLTSSAGDDKYPVFSPDGTKIAFQRAATGSSYDVMIMDADGTAEHLGIANARTPDWQAVQNSPPSCSALAAVPSAFERPDRRLHIVRVSGASDPDGDSVELEVTGVTQDEPVTGRGDHTRPDARLLGAHTVRIRSERSPLGDGRVYRIAARVTDSHGATCTGVATVGVQRHARRPAVDSAPPSYDSVTGQPVS
jgi:TolB protein